VSGFCHTTRTAFLPRQTFTPSYIKYPPISFHSTAIEKVNAHQYRVTGLLDLHGVSKEVRFVAEQKEDSLIAMVSIHQPDFQITPYRAFLGALPVKPDVRIEISLPTMRTAERAQCVFRADR
jgi:polyisoprenoid-binding protein YceI